MGVPAKPPPPLDPPPSPPPLLPFHCLRLTAKVLLRRLRCQEDLSFKFFWPAFGGDHRGTVGGRGWSQPNPLPPPPSPSDPTCDELARWTEGDDSRGAGAAFRPPLPPF